MTAEQAEKGFEIARKIKLYQNALNALLTDDPQLDHAFSIIVHETNHNQRQEVLEDFKILLSSIIDQKQKELAQL